MKARLKTTIENIKFQKDVCLFDDYEKLAEVQKYIEKLEKENKALKGALQMIKILNNK